MVVPPYHTVESLQRRDISGFFSYKIDSLQPPSFLNPPAGRLPHDVRDDPVDPARGQRGPHLRLHLRPRGRRHRPRHRHRRRRPLRGADLLRHHLRGGLHRVQPGLLPGALHQLTSLRLLLLLLRPILLLCYVTHIFILLLLYYVPTQQQQSKPCMKYIHR